MGDILRLSTAVMVVQGKVDGAPLSPIFCVFCGFCSFFNSTYAHHLVFSFIVISFYANPPHKKNRRAIYVADGQPFAKVMKAIVSNSEEVDLPDGTVAAFDEVAIVLERKL